MTAKNKSYQLMVIGAGPGGYAAAFLAADLGMKVALIDPAANPGGVCLYSGCIPSKALLHVAKVMSEVAEAKQMGLDYSAPKVSLEKMRAWKTSVVDRLTGGLGQLTKQRQIDYIQGTAVFRDANTVEIAGTNGHSAMADFESAIVATGSVPATAPALNLESSHVLDSTSALELRTVPRTMLVVGGGYIGLELGSVYASLGAKVSVVEMMPGLLPGADRDLVAVLAKTASKRFQAVTLNARVAGLEQHQGGIRVIFEGGDRDGDQEVYEKVLVAVGRTPNSSHLGLNNTGVIVNERGFIQVDGQLRTAEPSIFAIGDVVGEPMLAHKASHEGRTAVEVISGQKVAFEPKAIPAVIFTDPEIAWCGLTESEAKQNGREIRVAKFPWGASGRAMTLARNDGLTKLIIEPKTDRVLGVGIVGVGAGELIAEGVLAVEMAANATDLKLAIHPHPTLSETLMEAAEVYFGQSTHVYRPLRP